MNRSITISEKEFKKLYRAFLELELLQSSGVDNWQWYGYRYDRLLEEATNDDELCEPYLILERQVDEESERRWKEINE